MDPISRYSYILLEGAPSNTRAARTTRAIVCAGLESEASRGMKDERSLFCRYDRRGSDGLWTPSDRIRSVRMPRTTRGDRPAWPRLPPEAPTRGSLCQLAATSRGCLLTSEMSSRNFEGIFSGDGSALSTSPWGRVDLLRAARPRAAAWSVVTGTVDGVTPLGTARDGLRPLEATPPAAFNCGRARSAAR